MSAKRTAHPHHYLRNFALGRERIAALKELPNDRRDAAVRREYQALDNDQLGYDGRMDYAPTVSHVWELFMANGGKIHSVGNKIPSVDGLKEIVISEMSGLRVPDAFYIHFGRETGIHLDGHPGVFVDGVYFVHTKDFGGPMYMYMVACGNSEASVEDMSLGELTIEQTRIAFGTVEPTQQFSETIDDLIGDPAVCIAVKETVLKDIISLSLAFISDPKAAPDLSKEVHLSPPAPDIRLRN